MITRKKLIEVALPLEAINRESAREKSIRHGHPSTLHLWWARRPLASCRAVLFASIVDDPSSRPDRFPTEEEQTAERARLFRILEDFVRWETSNDPQVIERIRDLIRDQTTGELPIVVDPFAGGGSIPLEAQRLGLQVHASDLNPVSVLINKALIELTRQFDRWPPVNPRASSGLISATWFGASGLAADLRYYAGWIRTAALKRVGHLYAEVPLPQEYGRGTAPVIAWIWARMLKCPNPACSVPTPLARSFWLSQKEGSKAWVQPRVFADAHVSFEVRRGGGTPPEGTVSRQGARCLACGSVIPLSYIRAEGRADRIGVQLMAIVAGSARSRVYLSPTEEAEKLAQSAKPEWAPPGDLPHNPRNFNTPGYGLDTFAKLFTNRQLLCLTTLADLIPKARSEVVRAALARGERPEDAAKYGDAISIVLALALDKCIEGNTVVCTWSPLPSKLHVVGTFGRQALPMTWDYAEANPFGESSGNFQRMADLVAEVIERRPPSSASVRVEQLDASVALAAEGNVLIVTDPPYYDNIAYADLADFFYVWLRRTAGPICPELFRTLRSPREQELIAYPYRFPGGQHEADVFFEEGLTDVFRAMTTAQSEDFPVVLFYAFKQTEEIADEGADRLIVSGGWERMLQALVTSGFVVQGTWPMRTERPGGFRNKDQNALASSIVLVCRRRASDALVMDRRSFVTALRAELPVAIRLLQEGNIAPVDLAQSALGPGMAIFSRATRVLEADGSAMSIRTALGLVNKVLDEALSEQEGDFDAETRWAVAWFEQYGTNPGPFGVAETLSKAKNTAINGLVVAGILESRAGKVRLLNRSELSDSWDPMTDTRLTVWEVGQYLIRALESGGEAKAAELLRRVGDLGEAARELAYRLYTICERKRWTKEALSYNGLVIAWPAIIAAANQSSLARGVQEELQ